MTDLELQRAEEWMHAKTFCQRAKAMVMLGLPSQAGREASFAATALRRVRVLDDQIRLRKLRSQ
jgi:hypothetical protein